jgi:hypothetical protein
MPGEPTTHNIAAYYLLHHQKSSNDANNHFQKYQKTSLSEKKSLMRLAKAVA